MRTYTDPCTFTIEYPDDLVFSGDLNRIAITKNTTATHVEISYTLGGYLYAENLYFLTTSIEFSMADILKLLFNRTENSAFGTSQSFNFTVKLYNNTSLIDTESFSILTVILGKRRAFDLLGNVPNIDTIDFDSTLDLMDFGYYFEYPSDVNAILEAGNEFIDNYEGVSNISLSAVEGYIYWLTWRITNFMRNPNLQYLGGVNYWENVIDFPGCASIFEITASNKLVFTIPDESCGSTMEVKYTGRNFVEGQQYSVTVNIDNLTNPSGNAWNLKVDIGGNQSVSILAAGITQVFVTAGAGGLLKLVGYMDADTGGYGTHGFSLVSIVVTDLIDHQINLNYECNGVGEKLKIRFKNRFGLWRYYYVILKSENIASSNGISLFFLGNNYTELNNLFTEQQKPYSQSIQVYREGVSKEIANEFSDIIYSDHIHIFDNVNENWIPIKVGTNTFNIVEKENLFDVSLNLLLQSNNE